ncbi:MAG: hypothetical protein IPH57_04110 [Saprospiraceae bacterium]|nr:hypothetical protein [Saprospiraceae bacterium]
MDEINIPDKDVIIIDKSGSLISGNYKISGGSLGLFEGKRIGRKQSLEDLNSNIKVIEYELNNIEREINNYRNEAADLDKINIDQDFQVLNNDFHNIKNQLSQAEYKLDLYNKSILSYKSDIEKAEKAIIVHRSEIAACEMKTQIIDSELEALSSAGNSDVSEIDILMADLSEASGKTNNAKIELLKQQNLVSVLEKERDYKGSDKNDLENRLNGNLSLIEKMTVESEEMTFLSEKTENDLVIQYKLKAEFESQLNEIEKNYFEDRNTITNLETELSEKNIS